jgi:hypothetical protein
MRTVLTLAAAVVINAVALAALQWGVTQAELPPAGVVTIAQIDEATPVAPLAQAEVEGQVVRAANSL